MRAGDTVWTGGGLATCLPTLDFETYSEAGYIWDPALVKWQSLPGIAQTRRGISVVGARNYVLHSSFDVLSLNYDLFDDRGMRKWTKDAMTWPYDLFDHVRRGGLLSGWNVNFEWTVWNFHCTLKWGWPPLPIEQCRCDMAKARAHALPGALEEAGNVVQTLERRKPLTAEEVADRSTPKAPYDKDGMWVTDDDIPF